MIETTAGNAPAFGESSTGGSGRVARRRALVRQRILDSAEALMVERGVDAVTVDDIAAAADIARRSFYHHFDGKHDVLVPIARGRTKSLNRRLDRLVATFEDSAEGMAIAMRHALREIGGDPICHWFVLHSGLPHERVLEGLGESGMRDAQRAIEAGRLHVENLEVARLVLSGALAAIASARAQGLLTDRDLDDAVEHLLRLAGLDATDAHTFAHRPLPPLPADPGPAGS